MKNKIEEFLKNITIADLKKYDLDKPLNEKQHYIPKVYLKGFSVEGKVIIYDIDNSMFLNGGNFSSINNICKYGDLYVARTKEEKYSYVIEKILFSEFIEGNIESVIYKLSNQEELNEFEYNVLSSFIAFQFTRTKKFKDKFESNRNQFYKIYSKEVFGFGGDFEKFEKIVNAYQEDTGKSVGNIKDFFESTKKMSINVEESPEEYMKHMLEVSLEFTKYLLNCEIIIHHTRKKNLLITSDNPFYIIPPTGWKYESGIKINGIGFLKPTNARKIIHLSETLAVECFPHRFIPGGRIRHYFLNYKNTKILNSYIIKNAERFIIGSSTNIIDDTIKNINFKEIQDIKKIPNIKFFEKEQVIGNFGIYPL